MVQPRLSHCIKLAFNHSKNGHRNFSSGLDTPLPPSVARLLATGPADPSNVVVNGFVRSLRSQKQRAFASIGDGSSLEPLQALLTPAQAKRSDSCFCLGRKKERKKEETYQNCMLILPSIVSPPEPLSG